MVKDEKEASLVIRINSLLLTKFSDAQQKQENQLKAIRSFIDQKMDVIALALFAGHGNGRITACVIEGILLTGGYENLIGPMLGVIGVIQMIITFQGTLNSWWTKIAVCFLLCIFIVLQRVIVSSRNQGLMVGSGQLKPNQNSLQVTKEREA
ncbi:hypothetical protein ACFO25_05480 [Paenactinomyces guangxiensis]|uniref:hypothetical protein n=1 Tax=Paenactinomyces guangxiensis TaxID=1490290 RepID=UPI0018DE112A|nr:hypothetical protein [Paenactinomyces guangxiensis]MBH8590810.1 hypothetical protein [Paenactinomyces guangxiensis]